MKIKSCVALLTLAGSLSSVTLLTGCPAVIGVTAVTAASSAADRRTVGIQVEDKNIQLKANSALKEKLGDGANVNVTVYNRQVLLTGQAPDEFTRNRAEGSVSNISNVSSIVNDIQVAGVSSLTSRSNDAFITGKVKAALIDSQQVSASAFKVTTEAGTVYLMGLVTSSEADLAARIAAGVSGVQRVVKVLDLISESELAKINESGRSSSEKPEPMPQRRY